MFSHCYDNHPPRDLHFHLWSVLKRGTKMREQGMKQSAPNFILWPILQSQPYTLQHYALERYIWQPHTLKSKFITFWHTKAMHTNILEVLRREPSRCSVTETSYLKHLSCNWELKSPLLVNTRQDSGVQLVL